MPAQEEYRVTLDAFQGPLDLLLYLIRRAEVDIHDIPVAQITDQYVAFLARADDIDVEMAGEFLVMAATLIELKSRTLVPAEAEPASGGATDDRGGALSAADPRFDLVQQLLAYQRFRLAAEELDDRRREFARRFPRRPGRASGDVADAELREFELEDVHVMDLAEAYELVARSIDFARLGDHVVEIDETPVALHQEDLLDRLRRTEAGRLTLQTVFEGHSRSQRVGLFLATLELARLRRVTVQQDEIDAEIEVVLTDEGREAPEPPGGEATEA